MNLCEIQPTGVEIGSEWVQTMPLEEALAPAAILALAYGEVLGIVVPGFSAPEACRLISERIVQDQRLGGYSTNDTAASIKKLGVPLFEVAGRDPEKLDRYYAAAQATIRALRELSSPFAYPMDQLRLALQETWPAGADFETIHPGKKMFVGMPRVFEKNGGALPHVDRLAWDVPNVVSAQDIVAQLAINIHLRTADQGGEVELWHMEPDGDEYESCRLAGTYGLDREKIPAPAAVIAPKAGDLILFNSHRIHAVRPCQGGPRATVSAFLAYRGEFQPLTYWS